MAHTIVGSIYESTDASIDLSEDYVRNSGGNMDESGVRICTLNPIQAYDVEEILEIRNGVITSLLQWENSLL